MLADRCICLRKVEYSESSQILALFGRTQGLFRVIAKGAHRRTREGASRFDGGVDLLDVGDAVMTDPAMRDLATLTEWKLVDGHLPLRRDLRSMEMGLYCAELTGLMLPEKDPQPEVFDQLLWAISELGGGRREEALVAFVVGLIEEAGFMPELAACVVCGRPAGNGRVLFSPGAGGVVCGQCPAPEGPKIVTESALIRMLRTIALLPKVKGVRLRLPRLTRAQADPLNRVLAQYMQCILGRELRSASYVIEAPGL